MRTFGVEEELLLIDAATGMLAPAAGDVLRSSETSTHFRDGDAEGVDAASLAHELKQEQVELVSAPYRDLTALAAAMVQGRREADRLAVLSGARAVALGTYPMRAASRLVRLPRYTAMEKRYGITLKEQLTCGFHVHVSVSSDEEAVAVLDRIRIWLPVLLALSSNSPYWQGTDSGYASFRYQAWRRWPTAGPTDIFGSADAYRQLIETLLQCEVMLDEGMVYFDARLAARHPTVEVRIADVCLEAGDGAAIASLARALVESAARDWEAGNPAPACPTEVLRLASWKASSSGMQGSLLHPLENRPCPVDTALEAMVQHARPVLEEYGDLPFVLETIQRIGLTGTGADRQRRAFSTNENLRDTIFDAVERTQSFIP
jgi:carboxylate-amine ligase